MANMSYCRFRNTLSDLRDCAEAIGDRLSQEEHAARKKLVEVAKQIVQAEEMGDIPLVPESQGDED